MRHPLLLAALGLLATACSSGISTREGARQWYLVQVEMDRQALRNAGSLPLFRSVDGDPGVGPPRAFGSVVVNDRGRVACTIEFAEPTIALGGRPAAVTYEIVRFFGVLDKDGKRARADDLASRTDVPLGATTGIAIERLDGERIRVRTFTGDRVLPYVYTFTAGPDRSVPIFIPYVDSR